MLVQVLLQVLMQLVLLVLLLVLLQERPPLLLVQVLMQVLVQVLVQVLQRYDSGTQVASGPCYMASLPDPNRQLLGKTSWSLLSWMELEAIGN